MLFITPYDTEGIKWYKRYGGLISGIFIGKFFIDMNALPHDECTNEQNVLREKVDLLLIGMLENLYDFCGIDCRDIIKSKVKTAITEHLCMMVQRSHQIFNLVKSSMSGCLCPHLGGVSGTLLPNF